MNLSLRRDPDETRSLILATAWDLVRQLGARATIADIADRLKMSSANVYRYFPTKKALTDATCDMVLASVMDTIRAAALAETTPAKALKTALRVKHELMRSQMTSEARAHEVVEMAINEQWDAVATHHRQCVGFLAEIIVRGQAAGDFGPGDPGKLADAVMSACVAILHPTLIAACAQQSPPPNPEDTIAFALRALENQKPAANA
jgi:AcrR family transcriptional regulator